jgi:hypothetical protein
MALSRSDPFFAPKRRLARANQHLRKLNRGLIAFHRKNPYRRIAEVDLDTLMHKIRLSRPIPIGCIDAATEAIEALRSALDQIGYAAAIASGARLPKKTSFPFADAVGNLQNARGWAKDLPDEVWTVFCGFRPYKGGNDALWSLNKLCNLGKHAMFAAFSVSSGGIDVQSGSGPVTILRPSIWDSAKNEIIFAHSPVGIPFDYNFQLSVAIAFDEIDTLRGQPAIAVLDTVSSEVERILMATEAECRRLGFIA